MAETVNRRRKGKRSLADSKAPWGSLFRKGEQQAPAVPVLPRYTYFFGRDDTEAEDEEELPDGSLLHRIWLRVNLLSVTAALIFVSFITYLLLLCCRMWIPCDLSNIPGYSDNGSSRDLVAALQSAHGAEISFTEAEINRYLRDTCLPRQTGILSIFADTHGIALRIHNGYAELIVDRTVGANLHQTTSIYFTFSIENSKGRPKLKVSYEGGPKILGSIPCGGCIGKVRMPKLYMQTMQPALDTLLNCYRTVTATMLEHTYLPRFVKGTAGQESRVFLVPASASLQQNINP